MGFKEKMTTRSPRVLNSWLLVSTIGIIAVLLFYYRFVYVENTEAEYISKGFRVLGQMTENICNKNEALGKMAKTAVQSALENLNQFLGKPLRDDNWNKDLTECFLKNVEEEIKDAGSLKLKNANDIDSTDLITFHTFTCGSPPEIHSIFMKKETFFSNLLRHDVFDHLIVLEKQNGSQSASVYYKTFPYHIEVGDASLLTNKKKLLDAGHLATTTIADKNYRIFIRKMRRENGDTWYIGGAIEADKFKRAVITLSPGLIVLLVIGFLLFFFIIPLLKLHLMSEHDRLDRSDAILTTVSVLLITILLLLLNLTNYQEHVDEKRTANHLVALSGLIESKFYNEINRAWDTLKMFDDTDWTGAGLTKKNGSAINILDFPQLAQNDCDKPYYTDEKFTGLINELLRKKNRDGYHLFKIIFWMNRTGKQVLQLKTRNYGGSLSSLGHRDYFKHAGEWLIPRQTGKRFIMDSITSITSGEKLAAISIKRTTPDGSGENPLGDATVAAMTTQLTSLIDTVMPAGFGFCIIDRTGKTWFHSNTDRNLQENFVEETGSPGRLISALQNDRAQALVLSYQGQKYRCLVKPLENIPLFLVTFHQCSYDISTSTGILVYSMLFLSILLVFNGLLFALCGIINYRKPSPGQRYVYFHWLRPRVGEPFKRTYTLLAAANITIIALLAGFKIGAEQFQVLFYSLSALLFAFAFNFTVLKDRDRFSRFRYRLNISGTLIFLGVFLLGLDITAAAIAGNIILSGLIPFQAVLFAVLSILYTLRPNKAGAPADKLPDAPVMYRYAFFLLTWLVLMSVVPLLMFYNDTYRHEHEIAARHAQLCLARAIEDREQRLDRFYREKMASSTTASTGSLNDLLAATLERRKMTGNYGTATGFERLNGPVEIRRFNDAPAIPPSQSHDALYTLRFPFDTLTDSKRHLVYPEASNRSRVWKRYDGKLGLRYEIQCRRFPDGKKKHIFIESALPRFPYLSAGFPFFLSLLGIIATLVAAYFLLWFSTRNIFGLTLPHRRPPGGLPPESPPYLRQLHDFVKAGSHVLLICNTPEQQNRFSRLPERSLIPPAFVPPHTSPDPIAHFEDISFNDLRSLEEIQSKQTTTFPRVIRICDFNIEPAHFDSCETLKKDVKRLENLLKLMKYPDTSVIIPTAHPLPVLIDLCETAAGQTTGEIEAVDEKNKNNLCKKEELVDILSRIAGLLDESSKILIPVYVPLLEMNREKPDYRRVRQIDDHEIADFVLDEFKPSSFFCLIEDAVCDYYESEELPKPIIKHGIAGKMAYLVRHFSYNKQRKRIVQSLIIRIRELSHHYYYKILQSCTRQEKYLMYDLAQDLLVNPNSIRTAEILVTKGLLVYDGSFRFMNESFRDFILSTVDSGEARQLIADFSAQGRWKAYRVPIYLTILGTVVFLAFQQDLVSDLNAGLTSLIGVIAILTKFSGFLSNLPLKAKKKL